MKRSIFLLLPIASLISLAILGRRSTAQPAPVPVAGTIAALPDDKLNPMDIGLMRRGVTISIPDGYKLMMLTRIYHHHKLDPENPPTFLTIIPSNQDPNYRAEVAVFDPNVLISPPSNKLKLMVPTALDRGRWLTATSKASISVSADFGNKLTVDQSATLFKVDIGGFDEQKQADGSTTGTPVAEWHVTTTFRLEAFTSKELEEHKDRNVPLYVNDDPQKFPFVEAEDN